jgi:ComF family protein
MRKMSDYLLPRSCVLCGLRLPEGHFCKGCLSDLPWITAACDRCGQPLPEGAFCVACQQRAPPFEKSFAPLLYSFPVDSALKALKFNQQLFYAPAFGELLAPLPEKMFPEVDSLLPVPLHRRRHASRGFNQATELCRTLQRTSGLPTIGNVWRVRFTQPQTGLEAAERRRNMRAAFEVRGSLSFRHPLLIDDVITTGETCRQLAGTLLRAGAERVSALAVARAALP